MTTADHKFCVSILVATDHQSTWAKPLRILVILKGRSFIDQPNSIVSEHSSPSQILDSAYEAVNQELGHHCGEAEQPKLIVRETESMELVFRSADRHLQTLNSQMQIKMYDE